MSKGPRKGIVTIVDVARHAGVSVSTVSYVLSGKRTISASTVDRVHASIRTLGYHPHAGARSLASKRSSVLALVLPLRQGMHLPVLMQFATSVVTSARSHNHDVLLVTADEGPSGLRRLAAGALADGLILMDVEMDDPRVPILRELNRPSVLIGLPSDPSGLTCIDLDFYQAGAICVEHLADLGHREVALLGAPAIVYARDTGYAHRTRDGFLETAQKRGLTAVAEPCEEDADSVQATVKELLTRYPGMTGLVVHNESAVTHVLGALAGRVPQELSIVAIGPDELAERTSPPLSSVQIPAEEVGRRAVDLLMSKVDGNEAPDVTLLPPALTTRASSAVIPARAKATRGGIA